MIDVVTIYTPEYKSNTYILWDRDFSHTIVIDPTISSVPEIISFMYDNKLSIDFILPTHGHFDHIEGIGKLRNKYDCKVSATQECSIAFRNPKKNYSFYFENKNISLELPDIVIGEDNYNMKWNKTEIIIIKTPGHSPCSVCISIDGQILFTGDTILLEYSPFTKFPDGDANALKDSISMLFSNFSPEIIIYPGHGKQFTMKSAFSKFDFVNDVENIRKYNDFQTNAK